MSNCLGNRKQGSSVITKSGSRLCLRSVTFRRSGFLLAYGGMEGQLESRFTAVDTFILEQFDAIAIRKYELDGEL